MTASCENESKSRSYSILCVGQLAEGGTCRMRMEALRCMGHRVQPMSVLPFQSMGGRYIGGLFRRFAWGPPIAALNRAIVREALEFQPDVVWVDKGTWVHSVTLDEIRERCQSILVHYTPDPAIAHHRTRHFVEAIPKYDLLVTTKSYEVNLYHKCGAQKLLFQHPTFDEELHRPVTLSEDEKQRFDADVVFLGTYCKGREKYLLPLQQLSINLAIWGNYWPNRCRNPRLKPSIRGGEIRGREYAAALCGSKIALGLLSPLVPDRSTTRSLEIPAVGAFLLAERTDEHLELFEEGREAEFFECAEELQEKVQFYLAHPQERNRIAAAGRERCLSSGYSSQSRLKSVMEEIRRLKG